MKAFAVFVKKEIIESLRTYRFIIFIAVFVLLGIMSPMLAKMMPDILGSLNLEGMTLTIPEPTAMDSWAQFFKNVGQMGMLTLIIIFSGIMANEFSRGTLINLLTKGLKRETVILAKFTAASLLWALAYLVCLGVTFAYTLYFWNVELQSPLLAFGAMWLFGELLIAMLILGGTLFSSFYGTLLFTGGVIIGLNILNVLPGFSKYNPISLSGGTLDLLNSTKTTADFIPAAVICFLSVIALLATAIFVFEKKQV